MQSPLFYLKNKNIFISIILLRLSSILPEKIYLKWMFKLNVGYPLNLDNPKSFNEKLNWLKLYDRDINYTSMVDKYLVKKFVSSIIGPEYIIPTLGLWDKPEDIEWDKLPSQFVLKTTHGSGGKGIVICKNKQSFDKRAAIKILSNSLNKSDTYKYYKEWPYKNIKRRIIAEQFLSVDGTVPEDYKIHNFNGIPKFVLVCRDRYKESKMIDDFYTDKWEHMDLCRQGKPHPGGVPKPEKLELMLELSKKLAANIPFVRTDFYVVNGRVFFGEMTFYPASGMVPFVPESMDYEIGSWLKLPKMKK